MFFIFICTFLVQIYTSSSEGRGGADAHIPAKWIHYPNILDIFKVCLKLLTRRGGRRAPPKTGCQAHSFPLFVGLPRRACRSRPSKFCPRARGAAAASWSSCTCLGDAMNRCFYPPQLPSMSAAEYRGSGAANAFDKYNTPKTGIAAGLAKGHKVTTKKPKRAPGPGPAQVRACRHCQGYCPRGHCLAPLRSDPCVEDGHWKRGEAHVQNE